MKVEKLKKSGLKEIVNQILEKMRMKKILEL